MAVNADLPAELRLLSLGCDVQPSEEKQKRLCDRFTQSLNSKRVLDLAVRHGTAGLLYKNLSHAGCLEHLGTLAERLRDLYLVTAGRNLKLIHALQQTLDRLEHENIPVVVVQGTALLGSVYPDIGMRPLADVDLWIPTDLAKAIRMLVDSGYHPGHLYPHTLAKGDVTFDLHSHLLWADRIQSRRWLMGVDPADVFGRARPATIAGCQTLVLDPADQVIYLCLHALKHNLNRLIWLIDLKISVAHWTGGQWAALWDRAESWGQTRAVFVVLQLVQDLLQVDLRDGLGLAQAPVLSLPERTSVRLARAQAQMPWWGALVWLKPAGAPVRRPILMLESLFPKPGILGQVFPLKAGRCSAVLYALRLWQLVCHIVRHLRV